MISLFKINRNLSLSIFFFSLICLAVFDSQLDSAIVIPLCFFLISTIGVSHGSLDHFKGYKILKFYRIKNKSIFYLSYVLFSLLIIFLWIIFPLITLSIFLIIASFHFGKEDSSFSKIQKRKFINIYFFLKGSLIIVAPLWINPDETKIIFEILSVQLHSFENNIILTMIILSLLSNFFITKNILISLIDSLSIIILNLTFTPLVAFTIYFCFLHSTRHSLTLMRELNNKNISKGFNDFIKKVLPLTLVTAMLFLISVYFLTNYYVLDDAILKVIFIGLASLTFPHILLEYLLEKNEKRT
tara:strand:+ start:74 stop:973 length:900 start_codon:yes stop_codon:yes gene_type:complete